MAELNKQVLQEQLQAAAAQMIAFERHEQGYQGPIEVEDVDIVVSVRCADGRRRRVDPTEITDGSPRTFVRDYVRLGDRRGVNVVAFLERFLPIVAPKSAGFFNALRGIFGAVLVLALTCAPALAGSLVLEHEELERKVQSKQPGVHIEYADDRVLFRGRVRWKVFSWLVHAEAAFERGEDHRVHLVVKKLRVGRKERPDLLELAQENLAPLVDEETDAATIEIHQDGEAVFEQKLDGAPAE